MAPYPNMMNVWPQFRSPLTWDFFAVLTYLTVSVLFWYIGTVPDLAAARDRARTRRWQVFFGLLALGWRGSARHWARWRQCYRLTAAIAVPLVVSVHSEVSLLLRGRADPGLELDRLPALFRARRRVLRLCRRVDDRSRPAPRASASGTSSPRGISTFWACCCSRPG